MKCLSCDFENEEGAKFCKSCGAKLTVAETAENASVKVERVNNSPVRNKVASETKENVMTKGCKIWFWIVLVLNVLTAFGNFSLMSYRPGTAIILVLAGLGMAAGAGLILFKQSKIGLYVIIGMAVIGCIINLTNRINPAFAVISAVINPLISYYFVNKNSAVIK